MELNAKRLLGISHDMRTPLNAIVGFITLARKHSCESEYVLDCLDKVNRCSEYLLLLAEDVLQNAENSDEKSVFQKKPVSMTRLLARLREMFTCQAHQKQIHFRVWQEELCHDLVLMEQVLLERVLFNLVGNAIQYTPEGGTVEVEIRELSERQAGCGTYEITVQDSGIGMQAEYVQHAFEPFSREDNGWNALVEGTGLGLAIVKELVERMGWSLDVRSRCGQGTSFVLRVTFPLANQTASDTHFKKQECSRTLFHGTRVLLAEDDYFNRVLMRRYLEEAGIKADVAVNGQEAVKLLQAQAPETYDCILLDLGLPVLDGLTVARTIRKLPNEKYSSVPIVAVTGNVLLEERRRAEDAGVNGYIAKPVDQEILERVLLEVMGLKKERQMADSRFKR